MNINISHIQIFSSKKEFLEIISYFKEKKIIGAEIIALYKENFNNINFYISYEPLYSSYRSILGQTSGDCNSNLEEKIIKQLQECQNIEEYSFFFDLFEIIIRNIFQNNIQKLFLQKYLQNNIILNNQRFIINIKDLSQMGNFNSSFKFCVNEECKLYFQKNYNKINKEVLKLEDEILHKDFTKDGLNFIVHSKYPFEENKILIPYFTNQTLKIFLASIEEHPEDNKMTIADKIVILKEIGYGLDELHSQQIYHLNLCSSSIAINNKKDSYIFDFSHDTEFEQYQTKLVPSLYYRHPDLILCPKNTTKIDGSNQIKSPNEEKDIKRNIKYDLYSFGVLAHEIITEKSLEDRFGNASSNIRINQLTKNCNKFLFSEFKNTEEFDAKYGIKGIGALISKCMNTIEGESYSSVKEMMKELEEIIENLPKAMKTEINTRITQSIKSTDYECEISDLVINYYYGNETSKTLISSFINNPNFNIIEKSTAELSNNDDNIISQLLNFFNFKKEKCIIENENFILEDMFNEILQKEFLKLIDKKDLKLTNKQSQLMSLSIYANLEDDLMKYINCSNYMPLDFSTMMIPITTLDKFVKLDSNEINIPIFSYFIAKEISLIHSFGFYYGELSLNSIGIYYNSSTQTFVPSIIPFYFLFKNTQNKQTNKEILEDDDIEKLQQKDIKQFKRIILMIDKTRNILTQIEEYDSINMILFELYNFIQNQSYSYIKEKFNDNYIKSNYSALRLTYSTIHTIFTKFDKSSEVYRVMSYFLLGENTGGFLNLEHSITDIYDLICSMTNKDQTQMIDKINVIEKIEHMIKEIKKINENAICDYHDSNASYVKKIIEKPIISNKNEEISVIESSNHPLIFDQNKHTQLKTSYKLPYFSSNNDFKRIDFITKLDNIYKKEIFKIFVLPTDQKNKSFGFFF